MKKLLFFAVASLCFLFISPNQLEAQIGIRAGINMANVSGDVEGNETNLGFHFGIDYETMMGESMTFTPGLLYSGKGSKDDALDVAFNTTYLEIPLDFGFAFGEAFSVKAGPYIGLLLSADAEGVDISDAYNTLDFGLNLGLNYDVQQFTLGLGYGLGLSNIADSEFDPDSSVKNTNLMVYVVYNL